MDKRHLPKLSQLLIFGVSASLCIFPKFLPCDDDNNAQVVRCSGRSLKNVPHIESDSVTEIDLSVNNLRHLTNRTFAGVANLKKLNISNNCLPTNLRLEEEQCRLTIEPEALEHLKKLEDLDLSGNSLTTVPRFPKNMKYLNLSLNNIYTLSGGDFFGLTKLISLNIGWNCYEQNMCASEFNISERALRDITSLEILVLSLNNISSFPRNLPSSLTELYLAENKIWKIDKEDLCHLTKLRKLDVQWNCQRCDHAAEACFPCQNNSALQLGPGAFDCLTNLSDLNLRGNSLPTVNSSLFDNLSCLTHLDLSDNLLDLEKEVFFSKLPKLQTLDLGFNGKLNETRDLLFINPSVASMKSLKNISLDGYFFKTLDFNSTQSLLKLPNLEVITLRTNFILQANLSMLFLNKNIRRVDLGGNLISFQPTCEKRIHGFSVSSFSRHKDNIPGSVEFQHDTKIQYKNTENESRICWQYNRSIDLSFNNLMALHSDNFVGMEDVECLNISYNYINQRLDGNQFGHLKSLRHLDISYNRFDLYFYLAFSELTNLRILNLANNEYQFMMLKGVNHNLSFLENLTNLIELNLNNNMIGYRITEELKNPSLERLFFRNNELMYLWNYGKRTCVTLFTNITNLKLLDISYNKLVAIPVQVLEYFPGSLETLIISHNNVQLFHWEKITHLANLTHLDLSYNSLKSHYIKATMYSKLTHLNLHSNKITSVSKEFFDLHPELQFLFLGKNQIQTIDVNSFPKDRLQSLKYMDVRKNPFDCTCLTSSFIHFLMETNVIIPSLSTNIKCDSPDSMRGKLLHSMNPQSCQDLYGETLFLYSTFLVISWLVVTLTLKLFSWDLWYLSQVLLASIGSYSKLPGQSTEEYDAFIVFNTKDDAITDWVYHELMVQLEGHEMERFNLCLEDRDWLAGKSSIENLYDAIYKSKRTIFILDCEEFSTGVLCHAFLMSHQRLLDEQKDVVVLVILDHRMKMSPYLLTRKRICPTTFLVWPRNPKARGYFWHRLRVLLRLDSQHSYDLRLQTQLAQ